MAADIEFNVRNGMTVGANKHMVLDVNGALSASHLTVHTGGSILSAGEDLLTIFSTVTALTGLNDVNSTVAPVAGNILVYSGTEWESTSNLPDANINLTCKNKTGGTLTQGTPVYISGRSGTEIEVGISDADDAATMPAIGIVSEDANNNAETLVVTHGKFLGLKTNYTAGSTNAPDTAWAVGDELYVGTAGTLVNKKPAGAGAALQKIAIVVRVHQDSGEVYMIGAGRSNATPNLDNRTIFIGDNTNCTTTLTLSAAISNEPHLNVQSVTADTIDVTTVSATNAIFTSITALSSYIDVVDIKVRELSGYEIIDGNLTVQGDISASGDIYVNANSIIYSDGVTYSSQDATNSKDIHTILYGTSGTWGSSVSAMHLASDTDISSPAKGEVLVYQSSTNKWTNKTDRASIESMYNYANTNFFSELSYDGTGKLTGVDVWVTSNKITKLYERTFTYDASDNLTTIVTKDVQGGSARHTLTKTMAYDGNNNLTSVTRVYT